MQTFMQQLIPSRCRLLVTTNSGSPSRLTSIDFEQRLLAPILIFISIILATLIPSAIVFAEEPAEAEPKDGALETAVALNYCRASFHRIRKYQTPQVLHEEQEKILNNLNLSRLEDPEVIALYTSLLDEINQMQTSKQERVLYAKHHSSTMQRQLTWDALAFGTELATAQFGSAIKTGANSWWDYRNTAFRRDTDMLKVDKTRMNAVVQRSTQFLDTFWKLAQKKEIPDRWLVRGDDLDQLEEALQEKDSEVRLRVLRRMEPFMEAYPPYWYYVARTKQELGQLTAAIDTYGQLEQIGYGHFRRDDMLATAMANQSAIEDYLGRDTAVASAQKALNYSSETWEANLVAARVLQRHGQFADAEDAILRNLDVELEQAQSTVFLTSLYFFTQDDVKLAKVLQNDKMVARLPAPVLLRCAAMVGPERTPDRVLRNVMASLQAYPRSGLANDQLTVRVGHAWQLHLAKFEITQDGKKLSTPKVARGRGYYDLNYTGRFHLASYRSSSREATELALHLTYPDATEYTLTLSGDQADSKRNPLSVASAPALTISSVQIGSQRLNLRRDAQQAEDVNSESFTKTVQAARPFTDDFEPGEAGEDDAVELSEPNADQTPLETGNQLIPFE